MPSCNLLIGITLFLLVCFSYVEASPTEEEASQFLGKVNQHLAELYDKKSSAEWEKVLSGSDDNTNVESAEKEIKDYIHGIAKDIVKYKEANFKNPDLKRQLRLIPLTYEVLPKEEYESIVSLAISSSEAYKNVKLCSYQDQNVCNLTFFPDVITATLTTTDNEEKVFYWVEWRSKAAAYIKDSYVKFVELYRKAAKVSGFSTPTDFWYKDIAESGSSVLKTMEKVMQQIKTFQQQVHAFLRGQMREKYGSELIEPNKPMPDHLYSSFVDNATRSASNVEVLPYNTVRLPDITDFLVTKGYTAKENFETAHKFFTSLGMPPLEDSFWQDNCAPSGEKNEFLQQHKAHKFFGQHRVKFIYSTLIKEQQFFQTFSALSDVYYYRAFDDLNTLYQKPAILEMNHGVGKFFALAATSPKYLESLGLSYPDYKTKEARINRLYVKGMQTFFQFGMFYTLERQRVGFIDGSFQIDDNCATWSFSESITGVQPPVARSKSDFDTAISLTLPFDSQFATNIYMVVLEYQLFYYYCTLTGEYVKNDPEKPLDLCDLTGHPDVGAQIYKAMALGASVDSKDFLKALVGSEELDITGYLEYYKPLLEWYEAENKKKNNEVGWEKSNKCQA